jgi:hypothetical protein
MENEEMKCDHCGESECDDSHDMGGFKLTEENYPDVKMTLLYFIQAISTNAYTYLGLFPIPGTDKTMFKLDEAKRAIDLLAALVDYSQSIVDTSEKRELDSLLTQLRMNYVHKSQKQMQDTPIPESIETKPPEPIETKQSETSKHEESKPTAETVMESIAPETEAVDSEVKKPKKPRKSKKTQKDDK